MKKNYASGKVIEAAPGYKVTVGAPVDVTGVVAAGDDDALFAELNVNGRFMFPETDDGTFLNDVPDYLVTLEVGGITWAYRELMKLKYSEIIDNCYFEFSSDGEYVSGINVKITNGDDYSDETGYYYKVFTLAAENADSELEPSLAENDVVHLVIEPVSIALSDAFRAAVKKAYTPPAPEVYDTENNEGDVPDYGDLGGGGHESVPTVPQS